MHEELCFPATLPTIEEAVQALVREAMTRAGGVQTVAAKWLGISQPALSKRLKKSGP
jgi:DNA-binding protein Fis